jgi:aminopeptidase
VEDGVISDGDMAQGIYYAEIPTGEVFVAPVENSAEGKAVFPDVLEGRLELAFKGGKVIDARSKNVRIFWKRLKQATGERDRIAEFAIGLNPGVPLNDEKALGSIHIAIGKNNHIGGKNESSLHWDMIMPKPTIRVDGSLIMENGHIATYK